MRGYHVILAVSKTAAKSLVARIFKYVTLHLKAWSRLFSHYDIVHVHYPSSANIMAAAPVLLRRKPLVVTIHGSDLHSLPQSGLQKLLVGNFLRSADAVIAVSADLKHQLVKNLHIREEKISVIHVGCDLTFFKPRPAHEIAALKKQMGLDLDTMHILFVGAILVRKGLDVLFKSLAEIKAPSRPVLLIAGAGPEHGLLENLAKTLGISDSVRWLGVKHPGEISALYAVSDIFVLPSRTEGTPTVMLEAMASGTPAIVSRVGGVPEVIAHDKNGFMVEPEDVAVLGKLILNLAHDPELRARISRQSVLDMQEHSLARQVERIMQIYSSVAQDGK
jgi:glycosyltransferase involved in cell wall biosynthesis